MLEHVVFESLLLGVVVHGDHGRVDDDRNHEEVVELFGDGDFDDPPPELVLVVEEEEGLVRLLDNSIVHVELSRTEDGAERLRVLDSVLGDEPVEGVAVGLFVL